jgi:hypothetical protein
MAGRGRYLVALNALLLLVLAFGAGCRRTRNRSVDSRTVEMNGTALMKAGSPTRCVRDELPALALIAAGRRRVADVPPATVSGS